ncbi:hypothetical protein [Haloarchaeobius sp. DFWS5]
MRDVIQTEKRDNEQRGDDEDDTEVRENRTLESEEREVRRW